MATPLPLAVALLERALGLPEGSLADEDLARAEDALENATDLALSEAPATVEARWRTEGVPGVVRTVIVKAARREYVNPDGAESEGLGERSVGGLETSGVYLTAREVRIVRRAARAGRSGFVGTVRTPSAYEIEEGA